MPEQRETEKGSRGTARHQGPGRVGRHGRDDFDDRGPIAAAPARRSGARSRRHRRSAGRVESEPTRSHRLLLGLVDNSRPGTVRR